MKAYKLLSRGNTAVVDAPKPELRPDCLLVKVTCVALNPTDWKHRKLTNVRDDRPLTVGCDFSGVVEEVGSSAAMTAGQQFKPGDRVWGNVHGSHTLRPDDGAFAEYLVAKADLAQRVPDHMSFEEAASLGVQVYTVGLCLYQSLDLPWPTEPVSAEERFPVLIYGGSSSMGTLGIQMAKM
jgi:NADPH:quinone reductase-like Zn-dependent oxidoreductase